jgi:hypothetical protein
MAINVLSWVWEHAPDTLTPGEMLVALALANHAQKDGAHAYPSWNTLAKETRLNRRTVYRALAGLVEKGVIAVEAEATNLMPAMYLFPQFGGDKNSPPTEVRGGKMSPQNASRGDILSVGGDKNSPEPSENRQSVSRTPLPPSNGHHPRWEVAVGRERWQAITTAFTDANVQLDAGWLRTTLATVERDHPSIPQERLTDAVRSTLFKARDALGRENRIRNPRAFVAKELRDAVTEEISR